MSSTFVCTGINYSHEEVVSPLLASGFRALDILYLDDHKPAPIPTGAVVERERSNRDMVVRLCGVPVGSRRYDLQAQTVAEAWTKRRDAALAKLAPEQERLAAELSVPLHEVVSAYWVHAKTRPAPGRVRPGYVFREIARRFDFERPEEVWLNALIEPLADQLASVLHPGATLFAYNSSAWQSRLLHELARLAGATFRFLDDPFLSGQYWESQSPMWEVPIDFEPDDELPTASEVRAYLKDRQIVQAAKSLRHPLEVVFEDVEPLDSDRTWLQQNAQRLKRTSVPMDNVTFGEALHWAPRAARAGESFEFGFLGEDEAAAEVICAESKFWSAMEACVELSSAYPKQRILFRPHRLTPPASLSRLYACPNVYLTNWGDDELLGACGEIVSRTAINGLVAETRGREVMWASNVFYRKFELQKASRQASFSALCRTSFRSMDEIAKGAGVFQSA